MGLRKEPSQPHHLHQDLPEQEAEWVLGASGSTAVQEPRAKGPQGRPGPKRKKRKMHKKVSDRSSRALAWSCKLQLSMRVFYFLKKSCFLKINQTK